MWIPLAILAALSLGGGFINIPHFLEPIFPLQEGEPARWLEYVATAAGLGGIALAYLSTWSRRACPNRSRTRLRASTL